MRRIVFAAVALALAIAAAPAIAETTIPAISVTGEASIPVVPDLAIIDAGVASEAKTERDASDLTNAAMGKVMLAMRNAGISERDVQTQRLILQAQYAPNRNGPAPVVSYRASNRVAITLRDLTVVASTLDLLVGAGANEIGGVDFSVAQPSKLLDDARIQAVADARRKAEIYAKAAGVELGAPLRISEEGAAPMFARNAALRAAAASAPVSPGEETLRIAIAVTWAIKQTAKAE